MQTSSREALPETLSYPIVATGLTNCYNNTAQIECPAVSQPFYGQDAQFQGNQPSYTISDDGKTVYDNVTGLTWQRSPDTNLDGQITYEDKLTYGQALEMPARLNAARYGGYDDWRLPTIRELYSLMNFTGREALATGGAGTAGSDTGDVPGMPPPGAPGAGGQEPAGAPAGTQDPLPFIDTNAFEFVYGFTDHERMIDSQYVSSDVRTSMVGPEVFGLNCADGRIKSYGTPPGSTTEKVYLVMLVRGNTDYGRNDFQDNGDGTVTDRATGLTWSKEDSGKGLNWEQALAWVQQMNTEKYLGYDDWRLPDAKELQSILDYSRQTDATGLPAMDPILNATAITNEAGQRDYPFYWTATSFGNGADAVYIAFGRGLGFISGGWVDVHGSGTQRTDPKAGDPGAYPEGNGPQGDAVRINNFVRPVRG